MMRRGHLYWSPQILFLENRNERYTKSKTKAKIRAEEALRRKHGVDSIAGREHLSHYKGGNWTMAQRF